MGTRVSQAAVQVAVEPSTQKARVSQAVVQVAVEPSTQKARVSQVAVQVVLKNPIQGSFTADAYLLARFVGSFAANALTRKTQAGSFTVDAIIKRTFEFGPPIGDLAGTDLNRLYGTVTDGGGSMTFMSPSLANDGNDGSRAYRDAFWSTGGGETSYLKSDLGSARNVASATVLTGGDSHMQSLQYSTNGTSWTPSGATESMVGNTQTWTLPAPVSARYWRLTHAATGAGMQWVLFVYTWTILAAEPESYGIKANAVIVRTRTSSFTAAAIIFRPDNQRSITASAIIRAPRAESFQADALVRVVATGSFPADAIVYGTLTGSITSDAITQRERPGDFSANARIAPAFETAWGPWSETWPGRVEGRGSFDAGAIIQAPGSGNVSADAILLRSMPASVLAAAIVQRSQGGSFFADAAYIRRVVGAVIAFSWVKRTQVGSFSADADVMGTYTRITGSFSADSWMRRRWNDWDAMVTSGGQPALWYRLNEASGTFSDSGTVGAHLTSITGVTYRATGYVDPAVSMAGTGYARTASSYVVPVGNTLTIEAWVYPTADARLTILGCADTTDVIQIEVDANQAVSLITPGTYYATSSNGDVTLNAWNHIVYTRSGTGAGTHKIYVNGTLRTLTASNARNWADNAAPRYVGARTTSSQRWQGIIDEVIVYPRVLSAGEIAAHYAFRLAFTTDAIVFRTIQKTFVANAITKRIGVAGTPFTIDAWVAGGGSLTASAAIFRTQLRSFTASAVILKPDNQRSITTDAWLSRGGAITADAWVFKSTQSQFSAKAVIHVPVSTSFSASAEIGGKGYIVASSVVRRTMESSVVGSAIFKKSQAGSFSLDAIVVVKFAADAIVLRTMYGSFGAAAEIYVPRGMGYPVATPALQVVIDDVDITDAVEISSATFTMSVNGFPGSFTIRVRDTEQTRTFTSGAEIYLNIDGKRRFGGYVTQIARGYAFDYDDTTVPTSVARYYTLTGVDYNILFDKRILYDKTEPSNVALRSWPVDTKASTVIKYIFDNYTDLGADGAVYDSVQDAGVINPDKRAVIGSGGLTFGDAMREINRLLSNVWYFDQFKNLHFADVDDRSSPYTLTDSPSSSTQVGFSDASFLLDGTNLVNDAMVWGAGLGSGKLVFSREQDATSKAIHGRWQHGEFTTQLYKQASVDKRADSIVNGNEQSLRGHKDDREVVALTVYNTNFNVGQVVPVVSSVYGINKSFPIRKLTATFPTPWDVKYELQLSHDLDDPWNMYEVLWPKFYFGKFPRVDISTVNPCSTTTVEGGCTDAVCGITDSFSRTISDGWGTSDSGEVWNGSGGSVDPTTGARIASGVYSLTYHWLALPLQTSSEFSFEVTEFSPGSGANVPYVGVRASFGYNWADELWAGISWNTGTASLGTNSTSIGFTADVPHKWHILIDGTWVYANVWPLSGAEPAGWMLTALHSAPDPYLYDVGLGVQGGNIASPAYASFRNLDVVGVNRCSGAQFDNFNRTVAEGWGTSSSGVVYSYNGDPAAAYVSSGQGHTAVTVEPWGYLPAAALGKPITITFNRTPWAAFGLCQDGAWVPGITWNMDSYNPYRYTDIQIRWPGSTLPNSLFQSYGDMGEPGLVVLPGYSPDYSDMDDPISCKFQVNDRTIGLKGWRKGTPEPADWLLWVDLDNPEWNGGYATRSFLDAGLWNSLLFPAWSDKPAAQTWVEAVNIVYDSQPCGVVSRADDFVRTVASGNDWGTGGLGTWIYPYSDNQWDLAGVEDGSGAYVQYVYKNNSRASVTQTVPLTTELPYELLLHVNLTTGGNVPNQGQITFDFHNADDVWGSYPFTWTYWWGIDIDPNYMVQLTYSYPDGTPSVRDTSYSCGFVCGEDGWIRILVASDSIKVKTWKYGDPEPADPTVQIPVGPPEGLNAGNWWYTDLWGSSQSRSWIRYFSVTSAVNPSLPSVVTDCSGNGVTGTTQTPTVATTMFYLPGPFLPDSTRVWVNGVLRRPDIDYTEYPDLGEILFDTAVSAGSKVYIEYFINEGT